MTKASVMIITDSFRAFEKHSVYGSHTFFADPWLLLQRTTYAGGPDQACW